MHSNQSCNLYACKLIAQALIQLCQLDDGETQWIALQSLELLAIESAKAEDRL